MKPPLRVVKVGGSLFTLADLPVRLSGWLNQQPPGVNVLIAGGGPLAEEVRAWDERFGLGQERSHWLCVELLDITAELLLNVLPQARRCDRRHDLLEQVSNPRHRNIVFAPGRFLRTEEPTLAGDKLPQSWDVTSDSIAARLAEVIGATELVLLKSSQPKPFKNLAELGGEYVDGYFDQAARILAEVRFVNLRDDEWSLNS